MSKIYTKTGDSGETGLVSGTRISKSDLRIDLYGDVDELNSYIGAVLTFLQESSGKSDDLKKELTHVQSALFSLGSNLACEKSMRDKFKLPQLRSADLDELEKGIDRMQSELPQLKNFILPGGSRAGAFLHISRTICRRVERKLVAFSLRGQEELPDLAMEYLNRLSDYFFAASRWINDRMGNQENIWKA